MKKFLAVCDKIADDKEHEPKHHPMFRYIPCGWSYYLLEVYNTDLTCGSMFSY